MVSVEKEALMHDIASFGRWLKLRRIAQELTQADLAALVGCAVVTIRKIEADERRPSPQIAERLARHLNLATEERATFIQSALATFSPLRLEPPTDPAVPIPQRGYLPMPPTALIGRSHAVAAVCACLRQDTVRLLTLTGVGGVGKTRLAIQAATHMRKEFADGVWFVALAPISDTSLVIPAIAQALGVQEIQGQSLQATVQIALRARRLLLVLDNFEQILNAALQVGALLEAASTLKLLVTSRAALHLAAEHQFAVPPLMLPDPLALDAVEQLTRSEAAALFIARAQAVKHDFVVTPGNASAIAAICTHLDGLPLAIELAAARVKLFSPEALLARLEQRLALLTGGARDLPARQQTMRATIDWSYHLLDAHEQRLFARLAVFTGGWTLEAAETVCQGENDLSLGVVVVDDMATLVNQSLVQRQESSAHESRFTMLETIREYALERLDASGEAEWLRFQHAHYYLALGEVKWPEGGPKSPAQLEHLDRDYDNLWSALAWSQTSAGDPELALRLTSALRALWFRRGVRREAIAAIKRSLNHPHGVGRTIAQAQARFELGQILGYMGDYAAAQIQSEQALQLAHEVGDPWRYAVTLNHLGWLAREQGDSATAWARFTEGIAHFREHGYAFYTAEALNLLAEVAILDEDPARAEALVAESRAINQREDADPNVIGWALLSLGHAAQLRGAYDRAAHLHQESLKCFQAFGDQHFGLPWAYHGLGQTALGLGNLAQAARWLAHGLALSQTLGDQAKIAWCLAGLGSVAALDEQPARAARLWGAAERLRQVLGCRTAPAARATYERAMAVARAQLDEATFAAAWAGGRAMSLEQAIADALEEQAGLTHVR
jgi:predicted ATPase/transcriptional regulator with XRE-family HTH domain